MNASEARQNRRQMLGITLCAIVGAGMVMIFLGLYFTTEYRKLQLQHAAESGGLYVEGFLAPHAHEFFSEGALSVQSKEALESFLLRLPVAGHFDILKIWDLDGKMIFSTDGTVLDEDESPEDLRKALAGEIVVEVYTDNEDHPDTTIEPPYLEIHAPILDTTNSKVIAVGEIYQDATGFFRQRAIVETSIWVALGISSTIALVGLLLLVISQRAAHLRHVTEINAIARQNRVLKEAADRARNEASGANEKILNQIGADLHDGPIQMLSLLMLTLDRENSMAMPLGLTKRELGDHVIEDLRAISTGLVLPEIRDLTLEATLRLATTRHEEFTGNKVDIVFENLPETVDQGLKICCYRLVQEGLMNAHRHASGAEQRVSATVSNNELLISVSDSGSVVLNRDEGDKRPSRGIGLLGIRQRLDVFGGTLEIRQRETGGTELFAKIPLI
ncbi:sensor histidine kinase [Pseudorhodobacter wandonensis]|uniref:sensor histidine kinase n=1 Tax=Pseudorhodobacter wandonensis TaxID=1120568 RepID=UPI00067DECE3|nr:ATP-binding protein [Pseudorhodobacter wandonensis]